MMGLPLALSALGIAMLGPKKRRKASVGAWIRDPNQPILSAGAAQLGGPLHPRHRASMRRVAVGGAPTFQWGSAPVGSSPQRGCCGGQPNTAMPAVAGARRGWSYQVNQPFIPGSQVGPAPMAAAPKPGYSYQPHEPPPPKDYPSFYPTQIPGKPAG